MPSTKPRVKTAEDPYEDPYAALVGEISDLLAQARRKVNQGQLDFIDETRPLRDLGKLDRLLAAPAQFSHDLVRATRSVGSGGLNR